MRPRWLALSFILLFVACSFVTSLSGQPTPDAKSDVPVIKESPQPPPMIDLDRTPQFWFAPFPETTEGSDDYHDIFDPTAKWARAVDRVDVFKFYGGYLLDGRVGRRGVTRMIEFLNREGIAVAVELAPMTPTAECGANTQGYEGWQGGQPMARLIRDAGGEIHYLALDGPMWWGSLYDGVRPEEAPCHFTLEETAENVRQTVENFRAIFPDMIVGDIHAWAPDLYAPEEIVAWWDAYEAVMGEPFGFFHLDHEYKLPGWPDVSEYLMAEATARGIDFGHIYFGEPWDADSLAWLALAEQRYQLYENWYAGPPNGDIVFQSWQRYPDAILPETQPDTYAHAINRYFREPAKLSLDALDTEAPLPWTLSGRLLDFASRPIADAPVYLSLSSGVRASIFSESVFEIDPHDTVRAETRTEAGGTFSLVLEALPEGPQQLIVWYPGTPIAEGRGADGARATYLTVDLGPTGVNVAHAATVTASAVYEEERPALAVDGSLETIWNAGDFAPQWIELDLGAPQAVIGIQMVPLQIAEGRTVHEILVRGPGTGGNFITFHTFDEFAADMHRFSYFAPEPVTGIDTVRIASVEGPSWVVWREIEVIVPR